MLIFLEGQTSGQPLQAGLLALAARQLGSLIGIALRLEERASCERAHLRVCKVSPDHVGRHCKA